MKQGTKIVIGIGAGAALAYILHKYVGSNKELVAKSDNVNSNNESDSSELPQNREEKIEYIMAMSGTSPAEDKSGFNGKRFAYNPKLGYSLPIGFVRKTDSGGKMDISRDGNLANEIYFNVEGEQTDDPTIEAKSILDELTDTEIDIAYKAVRGSVRNPLKTPTDIVKQMDIPANNKKFLLMTFFRA